ncbi:hypothetical protein PVAG01_04042 [Phlyctema vagabunda]|uniref:Uncharacterized protein n=1 Tax=Phlyctema vagabunda TaxID=108571 RepID=A0ABR4PPD4_9HELO
MPLKAAGNITGLYYIPIAGLPWNTTWQALKDFVRNHPDGTCLQVERAHVYQNNGVAATDGYVCLRGSEHFHKAMSFLQGARLGSQYLMVIGTNETSTINLRDDELPFPVSRPRQGSRARRHRSSCSAASPSYVDPAGCQHSPPRGLSPNVPLGYGQTSPSPEWAEMYSAVPDNGAAAYALSPAPLPASFALTAPQASQYCAAVPDVDRFSARSATPQIAYGSYSADAAAAADSRTPH